MRWTGSSVSVRRVRRAAAGLAVVAVALASAAAAGPVGEEVVHGDARFAREGALTTIHAADQTIIRYQSFDIARPETVRFIQPGETARVLNRIRGAAPTQIDGTLQANGIVYFVNPAGVRFGPGAVVDVGQIVAAAGGMSNADFLAGVDRFSGLAGEVVNWGRITGDAVTLVGGRVANYGSIVAPGGLVALVAGDEVTLTRLGSQVMVKVAGGGGQRPGVENAGEVRAERGSVTLGAGDLFSLAVRNAGTVRASRIRVEGGTVEVGGVLDASSADGAGGTVRVLGDRVAVTGATIDASGATGGTVLIGGGYQGADPAARNASQTLVDAGTTIRAGGDGTVVVWSDDITGFAGDIAAGAVEVSSGGRLLFAGTVAAQTLLLDPDTITVQAADPDIDGNGTPGDDIAALTDLDEAVADYPDADSIITAGAVNGLLTGTNTLTLAAEESVTVDAAIAGSGNASLVLDAPTVSLNAPVTLAGTGTLSGTPATVSVGGTGLIQNGIDVAATGATVKVAEGTYVGDLVIDHGLTLTKADAADRDNVIIEGVDTLAWANWPLADPNVHIDADSVTLRDLTFRSPNVPTGEYSSGIVLNGQNNTIAGCRFISRGSGDAGCVAIQTYHTDVLGYDSDITGLMIGGPTAADENIFEGTLAGGYVGVFINRQGVAVGGGDTVTVQGNTMTGTIAQGIVSERSETLIDDNSLTTTLAAGSRGIMVHDFTGTPALDNVTITNTAISGFDIGLRIGRTGQPLTNIQAGSNTITANGTGVLVRSSADQVAINNNDITGNTAWGVQNTDAANTLDAENNWWGFVNGPAHQSNTFNVGSQGNSVSDNVDFVLWLGASYTVPGTSFAPVTNTTQGTDHASIQEAIDYAVGGDVIAAAAGAFTENLTVDVGVTIQGGGVASLNSQHTITASGVTLDGFTLNGGGNETLVTLDSQGGAIDSTTISNNTFNLDTDDVGIWVGGPAPSGAITNTTVSGNTFNGPGDMISNPIRIGGWFGSTLDVQVGTLEFVCNTVDRGSIPVFLHDRDVTGLSVRRNTFTNTAGVLYIWDNAAAAPTGELSNFVFANNDVSDAGGSTHSYGVGIDVFDVFTDANFGAGNRVTMNRFAGVTSLAVPAGTFHAVSVLSSAVSEVLDAPLNWWGSNTADGVAAAVDGPVDYSPWLDSDTPGTYTVLDHNDPDGPTFDFEDISGTGTPVVLGDDDGTGFLPIGFTFSFFGTDYTDIIISSNGYLTIDPTDVNDFSNDRIPDPVTPNGIVAGWWDDLHPAKGVGTIHYRTLGSPGSRRFIVQYTNVEHWPSGNPSTFQVKLFEGTHAIECHYPLVRSDGGTVTVGIENQTGTQGYQYYYGTAALPPSTAVSFGSPCGFNPDLSALHVDDASPQVQAVGRIQEAHDALAGGPYTLDVHAGTYNTGLTTTKPFTMNLPDGPVVLDTPGPVTFGDDTTVTGAQDLTFTNDVLGFGDLLIGNTGRLLFQPAAGNVTNVNAGWNLRLGGDLPAPPNRATISQWPGGTLNVTAGGNLTIGRNQIVSIPYDGFNVSTLTLNAGGTLTCTDLNAGTLNLNATTISVWQRPLVSTLRANNATEVSFGTELVGLDAFTATGAWQVIGSGQPPVLAMRDGPPGFAPDGFNPGTVRLRAGAPDAELTGIVPPILDEVLDLIADGEATNLATAFASAIPRLETVEVVPEEVELSAALRELLEQLGIFARDASATERRLGTFDDLIAKPPSEVRSEDHRVATTRLDPVGTRQAVDLWRAVFWKGDQYQATAIRATLQKCLAHCKSKHEGEAFDAARFRRCLETEAVCKESLAIVNQLAELFRTVGQLGLNRVERQISERIIVRDIIPRGLSGRDLIATIKAGAR